MKAVILCGGLGTRIRDASEVIPKPLLQIGGKPIVWHIMKTYASFGVNEFVLCLGYKGWLIKEYFLNYRAMTSDVAVTLGRPHEVEMLGARGGTRGGQREEGVSEDDWRVILAETGEHTATGGRLAAVRRYVEDDDLCLLTYGDGVADIDVGELVAFHRAEGKVATVTAVRPPGRYGEIRRAGGLVREFREKPQTTEGSINGGFFVFDTRRIWDYLGDDPMASLEGEPMQRLVRDHQLAAYLHPGFWQPMDTLREYHALNELWAGGRAPWATWLNERNEALRAVAGR
jgi:glucose-1-phosphate cytidylyltransferase